MSGNAWMACLMLAVLGVLLALTGELDRSATSLTGAVVVLGVAPRKPKP